MNLSTNKNDYYTSNKQFFNQNTITPGNNGNSRDNSINSYNNLFQRNMNNTNEDGRDNSSNSYKNNLIENNYKKENKNEDNMLMYNNRSIATNIFNKKDFNQDKEDKLKQFQTINNVNFLQTFNNSANASNSNSIKNTNINNNPSSIKFSKGGENNMDAYKREKTNYKGNLLENKENTLNTNKNIEKENSVIDSKKNINLRNYTLSNNKLNDIETKENETIKKSNKNTEKLINESTVENKMKNDTQLKRETTFKINEENKGSNNRYLPNIEDMSSILEKKKMQVEKTFEKSTNKKTLVEKKSIVFDLKNEKGNENKISKKIDIIKKANSRMDVNNFNEIEPETKKEKYNGKENKQNKKNEKKQELPKKNSKQILKTEIPFINLNISNEKLIDKNGRLLLFKNFIVIDKYEGLKEWNGYEWKKINNHYNFYIKARYDNKGNIWCITDTFNLLKLQNNKFKNHRQIGNEEIIDIVFGPKNIWAINRKGNLLKWGQNKWNKINYIGFHKISCITIDKDGNLWALNKNKKLAIWNVEKKCWNHIPIKNDIKIMSMDFDNNGIFWVITSTGIVLSYYAGNWINFGSMSFSNLICICFKKC